MKLVSTDAESSARFNQILKQKNRGGGSNFQDASAIRATCLARNVKVPSMKTLKLFLSMLPNQAVGFLTRIRREIGLLMSLLCPSESGFGQDRKIPLEDTMVMKEWIRSTLVEKKIVIKNQKACKGHRLYLEVVYTNPERSKKEREWITRCQPPRRKVFVKPSPSVTPTTFPHISPKAIQNYERFRRFAMCSDTVCLVFD